MAGGGGGVYPPLNKQQTMLIFSPSWTSSCALESHRSDLVATRSLVRIVFVSICFSYPVPLTVPQTSVSLSISSSPRLALFCLLRTRLRQQRQQPPHPLLVVGWSASPASRTTRATRSLIISTTTESRGTHLGQSTRICCGARHPPADPPSHIHSPGPTTPAR